MERLMQFDTRVKKKGPRPRLPVNRGLLIGLGVSFIVLSLLILGLSIWESLGLGSRVQVIELPGFHQLDLKSAGLYTGLYQHRGSGPIPVKQLSTMDVRMMSKGSYEEV